MAKKKKIGFQKVIDLDDNGRVTRVVREPSDQIPSASSKRGRFADGSKPRLAIVKHAPRQRAHVGGKGTLEQIFDGWLEKGLQPVIDIGATPIRIISDVLHKLPSAALLLGVGYVYLKMRPQRVRVVNFPRASRRR